MFVCPSLLASLLSPPRHLVYFPIPSSSSLSDGVFGSLLADVRLPGESTHANNDVEETAWLDVENAQLYELARVRTDAVQDGVDTVWLNLAY
jgi:hypothetical protein